MGWVRPYSDFFCVMPEMAAGNETRQREFSIRVGKLIPQRYAKTAQLTLQYAAVFGGNETERLCDHQKPLRLSGGVPMAQSWGKNMKRNQGENLLY